MKEKTDQIRIYDKDGFRQRAACVCVRGDGSDTEILLVSSTASPERFIVPGGGLEPGEDASTAAIREVMEEAGVRGTLGRCLGVFESHERGHRTHVFVLQVEEELSEWDESKSVGRTRKWFTVAGAIQELMVSRPVQCVYIQLLNATQGVTHDSTHIVPTASSVSPSDVAAGAQ
ncbi:diphosphoinositol polyphosphate phosphohydrolase 1 [Galendromus occidentalis]|uniref:diphosphoinositol-polyphosphate diphosphatase n=1 Tax=Galendromus occidentalis TaxID=34638 RepID=A0AAJ7WH58_9ACAR|nr:diphosphoinositol polyphosphate phosphohydrolase 1 [Galendromus occidentalis]